jgi:hypothetical protein
MFLYSTRTSLSIPKKRGTTSAGSEQRGHITEKKVSPKQTREYSSMAKDDQVQTSQDWRKLTVPVPSRSAPLRTNKTIYSPRNNDEFSNSFKSNGYRTSHEVRARDFFRLKPVTFLCLPVAPEATQNYYPVPKANRSTPALKKDYERRKKRKNEENWLVSRGCSGLRGRHVEGRAGWRTEAATCSR